MYMNYTGKTKTMTIGKQHEDIQIKLGGEVLEKVTKFVYLGGALTEDGTCMEDIRRRIGSACAAFRRLDKMWRIISISLKTKMKLYWALVLPVLMYGSECWTLRKENERGLLVAEMAWLRRIRRERIRNETAREELGAEETVIEKIKRKRLRPTALDTWKGCKRLPNAALHGHVRGETSRRKPRKRWIDNVREDLEERGIQLFTAYGKTKNREV